MAVENLKTLLICVGGIYVSYLTYGICQEKIYKFVGANDQYFTYTSLLLAIQCFVNVTFAYITGKIFKSKKTINFLEMKEKELVGRSVSVMVKNQATPGIITSVDKPSNSVKVSFVMANGEKYERNIGNPEERILFTSARLVDYMPYGISYIIAMMASNNSLKHINYPTQVLAKSCKMVPVLLFGVLFGKRSYPLSKYLCVGLITLGLIIFNIFSKNKKIRAASNSTYGLCLLGLSLCCDGISALQQDVVVTRYRPSTFDLQVNVNVWGVLIASIAAITTKEFLPGFQFIIQNPTIIYYILEFAICSSIGQLFIFLTVRNFQPIVLATITTTRKFFTILLSVIIMGNPLQVEQWVGILLVFIGLASDILNKQKRTDKTA
ncbi:hypothetical protein WA158_004939 [Blastocystis sp. Blastoise]